MEHVKDILELSAALVTPIAGIVLSFYGWKQTGRIDLQKTLELAGDVVHIVHKGVGDDGNEEKALNNAVAEVEKLRGKKLSNKLRRKLKARLQTLHNDAE